MRQRRGPSPGTPRGAAGRTPSPPRSPDTPRDAQGRTPSPPHAPEHTRASDSGYDTPPPPGPPGTRPRESWCYIQREAGIDNTEASLRFALVAQTPCGTYDISADAAVEAICATVGVQASDLVVKRFYPENFIVICNSQAARDRVLAASPLPLGATSLVLRPWTRLAHADVSALLFRVNLVLEGIPPHAWREDTAAKILAPYCWVQSVEEATASGSDLSAFRVTVWTAHPSAIPLLYVGSASRRMRQPAACTTAARCSHRTLGRRRFSATRSSYTFDQSPTSLRGRHRRVERRCPTTEIAGMTATQTTTTSVRGRVPSSMVSRASGESPTATPAADLEAMAAVAPTTVVAGGAIRRPHWTPTAPNGLLHKMPTHCGDVTSMVTGDVKSKRENWILTVKRTNL